MANQPTNRQQLDKIADEIVEKDICPELRESATQLVFASGNPEADIVFIGEAPGKNEDEQGEPFVGAAGKFLNEMLETIGMKREDVYITNIVKYRPPNNRDPLPDEKRAFWPYLVRQLEVIKPKLVVTLGRHSMEYFLPGLRISQCHGQPKRIHLKLGNNDNAGLLSDPDVDGAQGDNEQRASRTDGATSESHKQLLTRQSATKLAETASSANWRDELVWVVLPLYHPAAALYNGGQRQMLIDDFAKIPAVLNKI